MPDGVMLAMVETGSGIRQLTVYCNVVKVQLFENTQGDPSLGKGSITVYNAGQEPTHHSYNEENVNAVKELARDGNEVH